MRWNSRRDNEGVAQRRKYWGNKLTDRGRQTCNKEGKNRGKNTEETLRRHKRVRNQNIRHNKSQNHYNINMSKIYKYMCVCATEALDVHITNQIKSIVFI